MQYARSITDLDEALERHRPILNAIVDGDVEGARLLAHDHARICASYIENLIHEKGGAET